MSTLKKNRGGGAVGKSVGPAGLGDRIPSATDLSRKTGSDTAKRSVIGVSVKGPRR